MAGSEEIIEQIADRAGKVAGIYLENDNSSYGLGTNVQQSPTPVDTDSRDIANSIFPASAVRIPAEQLGLGDAYDMQQAQGRVARMYAMDRKTFYAQSKADTAKRLKRLVWKSQVACLMTKQSEQAKKNEALGQQA